VSGVYLDTSALARVMLGEPDGPAILTALDAVDTIVSSRLLDVELRRVALREKIDGDVVSRWLAAVALVPVEQRLLDAAGRIGPNTVTTLDAIHLVCAIDLAEAGLIGAVMTFDNRLADDARSHGLEVLAPPA